MKSNIELNELRKLAQGVRLMATDLDGTLLDRNHVLSDENRSALKTLAGKGVILAAATGRARTSIPETIVELPGVKYLISANGAKIYINGSDEIIYGKHLTNDAIEYIRPFFSDAEVLLEIFWDGSPHVEEARYIAARDYGVPRWFSDYFFNTRIPTKDFEAIVDSHINEIENITFVFANDAVKDRVYAYLEKRTDIYTLTSAFSFHYEIGGVGVNKAAAVDFIAKREGILPSETLCFGDHDNDVSMIKYAGIGVATANASPGALSAANLVTESSDDSGVAAALKTLGLI